MALATLVLAPFYFYRHPPFSKKGRLHIFDAETRWTVLSGFFLFLHFWTYMLSAQNTKIANCMIIFSVNPLFVAVGAQFMFREKITLKLIFGYLLAGLGIYVLVAHDFSFDSEFLFGDSMSALSAVLFAAYILTGHQARKTCGNLRYVMIAYFVTALCFAGLTVIQHKPFLGYGFQTTVAILCLVAFPTLLGHALFTYLLKFLNINLMSCGKLVEPALAAITAYFVFYETLGWHSLFAFALTTAGLLVLLLRTGPLRC